MEHKIQTTELQNFTITMDGEVVEPPEPGAIELATQAVVEGIGRAIDAGKLQVRMFAFDALHGTNYRQIRNTLAAQKRREQFESSIGLVAVGARH